MKPSELAEGQQIHLETKTTRIDFIRDYTVLTVWATGRPENGDHPDPEHHIQITPSDKEEEIDEFYNNLLIMNPDTKAS